MNIVIDTNKFISALMNDGISRKIILETKDILLFPEFSLLEIFNHYKEILDKSGLSEYELFLLLTQLLTKVTVVKTDQIIHYKKEADEIMRNIDIDDAIFIATALCFDCPIWSDDNHFKKQNRIKLITTEEMLKRT